jgi:hypothetical protein
MPNSVHNPTQTPLTADSLLPIPKAFVSTNPETKQIDRAWAKSQRDGKYSGPRYRLGVPPRRQWNLTPKQVARFLDNPHVVGERAPVELDAYCRYAAGNTSVGELAERFDMSEVGFLVYVYDIEKNILRDAAGFNLLGPVVNPVPFEVDPESVDAREAAEVMKDVNRFADSNKPGEGGMEIFKAPR